MHFRTVLYDMTKSMMSDMNVEFEYQIRRNLKDWLTNGAAPGMPVEQAPLGRRHRSRCSTFIGDGASHATWLTSRRGARSDVGQETVATMPSPACRLAGTAPDRSARKRRGNGTEGVRA